MADKLTKSLKENNNVNIDIGRVSLSYFGDVQVNDIFIEDHHQDTLIFAQELRTSILGLGNLLNSSPKLGKTTVQDFTMRMRRYEGEDLDNMGVFISKLNSETSSESKPFKLNVSNLQVLDSRYSFIDENNKYPEIIKFDELSINADNFGVDGAEITADIKLIRAHDKRGMQIKRLSTNFLYNPTEMKLSELEIITANSEIYADLDFKYQEGDFGDFFNKVKLNADFHESEISSDDLQVFYDAFGDDEILNLSVNLSGTLNDLQMNDVQLFGLDRSAIYGDLNMKGAFTGEAEDFELIGDLRNFSSNYYDLVNFLPGVLSGKLPQQLSTFGSVRVAGNAKITSTSVDLDINLNSQLGSAIAKINFDNLNSDNAGYAGNLTVKDFNIGRLIENKEVGKTSFNLDIDGTGFTADNLNTKLKGQISKLGFKGYNYSNIRVIGNMRAPVFNGNLAINDPNLRMEFNGLADLSSDINNYDFEASVGYADLFKMNLITRDTISIFKGDVIMNMAGTNIDDAVGEILLLNTSYENQMDLYRFDDFSIKSSFNADIRTIAINSPDVLSGEMEGRFRLSELQALFQNSIGSIYTNYEPNVITNNQFMEFDFDIYNKIVEVFYPDLTLSPNTFLRGRVESDESEFTLNFRSPKIDLFDNMFQGVNLQVDNTNPIYNTYFEADSVATASYNFSEFSFINVTQRDTLFIRSEFKGGKSDEDVFNLNLYHTINKENQSVVGIQRSDLTFKQNTWYINQNRNKKNKIVFENSFKDITIDSLVMNHGNEEIRLSGVLRDSTYKDLQMNFDNVDLHKITPEIDSLGIGGILNGKLDVIQEKGAYYPNTSMMIDSLKINEILLGNMSLDVSGNENLTSYNINAQLRKEGIESLSANGAINVEGSQPTIDLEVALQKLNMAAFSPLGGDVIANIRGLASGTATVTGNYKNPDFGGSLFLDKAGLKVPYLNVDIDFLNQAEVILDQQQFIFNNIDIRDTKYKTRGILKGNIAHENFTKWFLDLGITTDRLLVLDTEADEDALYYGTAFISGDAGIKGPTDELVIDVNATTEEGTIFKIPLSDEESVGDNSYIHFLTPEEKAARAAGKEIEIPEVKGIELLFDLDVTRDAEVEVVIDQTSGSTLRGRGAGNLLLEINTSGKFNMWGDFIVYEGVYNFKYAGLVQKVFNVKSGGSINWDGNPLQAELNVSAIYSLNANPAVLLENPSVNRKIPVDVVINLQGQVIQPDINFDIQFPTASSVVRSELEYRMDDRASRELQALFLVTQNAFYSEFGLNQTAITGTLAERASSIVNDIFADDDGKFQVGVNYVQGDRTPNQQTVDRFGLTLSTQISERVLINGAVGVPIGGTTESVIVGDLEIDFLLNEDGSLRATVFNRENNIQFIGEQIGFTQGVGLSYSVDFDTFKELIRKITNKELESSNTPQENVNEKIEAKNSLAPDYINFPSEDTDL
ncbi:translocation/assembly module TamB domain-containing protein [Zunongwangia endophytica]|uniref:Translocation/assembly module TamB domain-containing protein n=1 Tax=Zunongwangia endophytica TaxID=1808945 RepID=A0ABV8HCM2_9FLAO|nr:translocation/assembly module TamB domain-containing protein [Zunongwangia endophytica]MDN3593990.1 translocation/assembly module TamB domain-containing protein [Zunongwangia endophytica]